MYRELWITYEKCTIDNILKRCPNSSYLNVFIRLGITIVFVVIKLDINVFDF